MHVAVPDADGSHDEAAASTSKSTGLSHPADDVSDQDYEPQPAPAKPKRTYKKSAKPPGDVAEPGSSEQSTESSKQPTESSKQLTESSKEPTESSKQPSGSTFRPYRMKYAAIFRRPENRHIVLACRDGWSGPL